MTYTVIATGGPAEPLAISGLPEKPAYALVSRLLRRDMPVGTTGEFTVAIPHGQLTVQITPADQLEATAGVA